MTCRTLGICIILSKLKYLLVPFFFPVPFLWREEAAQRACVWKCLYVIIFGLQDTVLAYNLGVLVLNVHLGMFKEKA